MIDPRIIDIIRRVTRNPDITTETMKDPFTVLGWDSLKSVEILIEIQDVFGVGIEAEEILRLRTVQDLQDLIDEKRKRGFF